MTNPTSNFGWQMPTSTDLVTDLPADFEVFGQAVDTSLADLKGGTTGQVLSKASNTNMDFTWVTTDDANAIQNTIVDAKGDLISATGSDVPARLAVGANGLSLVADSTASTGLKYGYPNGIGCSLYKSANQSIANVTETAVTFDIEQFDTSSFHSNVTNPNRMTIPTGLGGKYILTGMVVFAASATSQGVAYIYINNALNFINAVPGASATVDKFVPISYTMNLSAGDYVEVRAYQDSGAAQNVLGINTYYTNVQLAYLGA